MIIHFKKKDGNLGAGNFVCKIAGSRTAYKSIDGTQFQISDEKIVAKLEKATCWRCLGLRKVYAFSAMKYYTCPACEFKKKDN